ncbi:cytochrome ubiquinol oxidase subunit I [Desertibaculum subflavum]|uniref:cytochrome ubiquinol oxidase subunit I n=1 Tax=Desertibaculum subflavum TaxID=2268458 RepID=UPI000E672DE9
MEHFDATLLARIQFGFTIGFHILFPTFTIGIAGFLLVVEALWLKTGDAAWRRIYGFWVRLFALAFGMGVVSGVVLSYQFGTNFSAFSQATGDILGPLMGYEVLTAFFLEAGFLGIMLFGWDKVGPRLHLLATAMVAVGTVISAFWILAANSWMQTPAGFVLVSGRFVPEDWWAIVFNPSFPHRLAHMVTAAFLTSAFAVAGVSAWQLLRGVAGDEARRALALGVVLAAILAPLQVFLGDQHGLNVKEHQPVKVAAMEGLWQTARGVPLVLFALPDMAAEKNHFEIAIPKLTSLILTHDLDGEVKGLTEVPPADRPNVPIVFFAFRVMVGIGFLMVAVAWVAAWRLWRRRLAGSRWLPNWLLWALTAMSPSGFIAVLAGWLVAEVGRQPFVVYGLMRTADAVSPVTRGEVLTSLALFVIVYVGLLGAFLWYVARLINRGIEAPKEAAPPGIAWHGGRA